MISHENTQGSFNPIHGGKEIFATLFRYRLAHLCTICEVFVCSKISKPNIVGKFNSDFFLTPLWNTEMRNEYFKNWLYSMSRKTLFLDQFKKRTKFDLAPIF